jgi:hypothetical protein
VTSTQPWRGLIVIALAVVAAVSFGLVRRTRCWQGRESLPAAAADPPRPDVRPSLFVERSVEESGWIDICLHTRFPKSLARVVDGQIDQTITGTVIDFGSATAVPPLPGREDLFCENDPQWYVDVADARKVLWRLLYSVSGIALEGPALTVGARVTVRLRAHWGFAKAAGVIVSDEAGVVFAAEQGAFGHALEQEDVEPLRIRVGDVVGVKHEGCGDAVLHAVDVHGDTATRVWPGRVGTVGLRGKRYQFWNAASYNWINPSCTDMLDRLSWFLWRS